MKILFLNLILFNLIFSKNLGNEDKDIDLSQKRYITDEYGNILMRANIWGEVNNPGSHIINEGVDILSFLSIVGGPIDGSNLSKITLYRENIDGRDYSIHLIDLSSFLNSGKSENIMEIKPNDTIIIPQKRTHYLLTQINSISTILNISTLIFQILNSIK